MLSIIVSSYQKKYFKQFSQNVKETIGAEFKYEIIQIWNPNTMGICEAYNKGGELSKYENLLFIHEDILFETQDWGNKLIELISIKDCGVVGVAGSDYYGFVPSSWNNEKYTFINILQCDEYNNNNLHRTYGEFGTNSLAKVKVVDGVFIACKKNVFEINKFNEKLKGFHGYDMCFSLKVLKNYQNYVTNAILIKHYSRGNLTKEWLDNIIEVNAIFKNESFNHFDKKIEFKNFNILLYFLSKHTYSLAERIKYSIKYLSIRRFGLKLTLKMLYRMKYILK